jgi:hypothetical protein
MRKMAVTAMTATGAGKDWVGDERVAVDCYVGWYVRNGLQANL